MLHGLAWLKPVHVCVVLVEGQLGAIWGQWCVSWRQLGSVGGVEGILTVPQV